MSAMPALETVPQRVRFAEGQADVLFEAPEGLSGWVSRDLRRELRLGNSVPVRDVERLQRDLEFAHSIVDAALEAVEEDRRRHTAPSLEVQA